MRCSRIVRYAVALVPLFGGLAQADDIVTSWNSVHLPPPPTLTSVTVDPAHTERQKNGSRDPLVVRWARVWSARL